MPRQSWLLTITILCVILVAGATAWYALADNGAEDDLTVKLADEPPATANPVVAVVPYRSETEYEPDPFEPDRLRLSKTEVKELILVRADGTVEHKRAW